jgi:hypothetical protein
VAKPATGEIYRTRIISKEQWRDGLTSAWVLDAYIAYLDWLYLAPMLNWM